MLKGDAGMSVSDSAVIDAAGIPLARTSRLLNLWRTSVGKKIVMAVTGIVLLLFVIAHMLGNLKIYLGAEAYNHYAVFLREVGGPLVPRSVLLWIARLGLLACVVLHIVAAYQTTLQSRAARLVPYRRKERLAFSYSSYTMRWGGVLILLFVIYHILHFTFGTVHPSFEHGDVYHNVVAGFSVPVVSLVYILMMVVLGFHLYHGLWSSFQTLGINHPRYNTWRRPTALAVALIVVIGNISIPLAVLTRIVK
jgi:succinate dehydrogenase / fumarate reductase, cytochrome b subunit